MPQAAEEFLPEPACQGNAAFHQRRRKVGMYQLGKDGMTKIVEQDRALVQVSGNLLQVGFCVAPAFGGTNGRKERHEKVEPGVAVRNRNDGAASFYGFDKVRFGLFLSSEHKINLDGLPFNKHLPHKV